MKLLQKLLIGGMLLSSMLGFGDSFMNDWKLANATKGEEQSTASYGYPININKNESYNTYNGVIDGTDSMSFKSSNGTLSFLCNTRSNNSEFCSNNGEIDDNLFKVYLASNYFNIITTDIPYELFEGKPSNKRMFFRSYTTNKGDRKIIILKRERWHTIDIYSLNIKDNRDIGKQQKAVMESKIATFSMPSKVAITFLDTIDFRSLATNKESFEKIDTLQTPYAVIGVGQFVILTSLDGYSNYTICSLNVNTLTMETLRAGMLAIDKNGFFSYYVSAMQHSPTEVLIFRIDLQFTNGQLVLNNKGILCDKHGTFLRATENRYDPLIKIATKNKSDEADDVILKIKGKNRKYVDANIIIGKMGEVKKQPKDYALNTSYKLDGNEKNVTMNYAKNYAQRNGFNIDLIIYGAPYMFIRSKEHKDSINFPSIEKGDKEIKTTWNSWSKGGSVSIGVGVSGGVKAGIVSGEASMGIYASIAHTKSEKFTDSTSYKMTITNPFYNDENKKDWSVGSVYFSSSKAEYNGYCYLSPFNNGKSEELSLKGLEQCPFTMIMPYIKIKPTNTSIAYNYYTNETDKRVNTWNSIDKLEAKKIGMLTAGIANYTVQNGSRLLIIDDNDSSKIEKIINWQKNDLNLGSFFEAGKDNEYLQSTHHKPKKNFTGVVKGVGCRNITNDTWGLRYTLNGDSKLAIEQTNSTSMQKETTFAFGFNRSSSVSIGGIGGYNNVSAEINGSYANGEDNSTTKYFNLTTYGGTFTGNAAIAVAEVNVGLFKSWLGSKGKELKRPGWISEYAWENNSRFTAVIPFLWEECLQSK